MKQKLPVILLAFGLLLVVGSAILEWGIIPLFLGEKVVQGMRMLYGPTGAGEHWKRFGLPTFAILDPTLLFVYFYNVTNADDIIRHGIKPILNQVGPYVYTVETITEPVAPEVTENETVSFREKNLYYFNPLLSGKLSEDDEMTVLNIPFLKVVDAIDNLPKNKSIYGSLLLSRSEDRQLFIQHPVRDLLFSGFTQPTLEKAQKFIERNSSPFLPDDKFGLFYPKNGTMSKLFKVYAGLGRPRVIGKKTRDYSEIVEYDGKPELDSWAKTADNKCNEIDGTGDGMIFSPATIKDNLRVSIFRPEMCRSLYLRMNGHIENHGGLPGYRFILPPQLLQDSSVNFDNNCLCPSPGAHFNSCVKAGTLSNCREGFPFITSLPHFLDSPVQSYVTQVVGLSPDREKHGTFIDLEPVTGLALKSSMKFQLNYEVKPSGNHDDLKKIPQMLFPLLWTDEVKSMHFILSKGIQEKVLTPVKIMEICKWVAFAGACVLLATGLLIYIVRARKKNYPV